MGSQTPVPLAEERRVFIDAKKPSAVWSELEGEDDLRAMRGLAAAVMGDVHGRRAWSLAWNLAIPVAHHAFFRPFGAHIAESDHFARLVGRDIVSCADMAALQRLYTLAHAGCTTVLAWDRTNRRMVHFRSLDWPSAGAIACASRIYQGVGADGAVRFSAVGILGMAGLLTAVKPGFSVAINFAPWSGPSLSPGDEPTFLMRDLMASAVGIYREAFRAIAEWRPAAPVFISLCGTEKGEGCVFEFGAAWTRPRHHVVPMGDDGMLVQTNHFAPTGPFAARNRAQAATLPWDDPTWEAHGILKTSAARKALVEGALEAVGGQGLEEALRGTFVRRPVWNHETAQWAMMVPGTGEVRAWVRG